MKRYSIFQAPVLAFGSPSFYRDVGRQWKGVAYGYLLLLLIATWIAPMVTMHIGLSEFLDNEAPKIVKQIPKLTISGGRASIEEPQPYSITEPESGQTIVVIDTTGQITSLDQTDAKVLITATDFIMEKNQFETQTFNFAEIDEFVLEQDMINSWLEIARTLAAPILYVMVVLGAYVFRILQSLVYGCIGLAFASMCNIKLPYGALIRLSVISVTPGIIVDTVLMVMKINVPFAWFWYFLAAMMFLLIGVKSCAGPDMAATQAVGMPEPPVSPYTRQEL